MAAKHEGRSSAPDVMAGTEAVQCPICSKEFPAGSIEAHAAKCLFLNESTQGRDYPLASLFAKRPVPARSEKSPGGAAKRPKKQQDCPKKENAGGLPQSTANGELPQGKSQQISAPPEPHGKADPVQTPPRAKRNIIGTHVPLAEQMRPNSIVEYVGQSHLLGEQSMLFQLLEKGTVPNMILWGPPGCGKTSLANVIANVCKLRPGKLRYVKLSAAMAGIADVKECVKIASNDLKFGRQTVLFLDEIHRFNKSQQDFFLPHVESGSIRLIGATTENPSFSLNSALLSRCRVLVLEKLSSRDLVDILSRAVVKTLNGKICEKNKKSSEMTLEADQGPILEKKNDFPTKKFIIERETIEWLAETCDGDARIALGGLELAVESIVPSQEAEDSSVIDFEPCIIGLQDIAESLKKTHALYDRKGDQHYDMISALHKSVRASDDNAAIYWLSRMIAGGEDPVYLARRMVRMSCEDIGLEDPQALGVAVHTMQACQELGMPECDVVLAQCVTYLARAPKSRLMEDALRAAQRVVADQKGPQPGVPLHLRNAPTKLMSNLGYGKGYNMLDKEDSGLNYLPEGLEDVDFFGDGEYRG